MKTTKYEYTVVEFSKDRNILTTVVEKVDNLTGEVIGRTSYKKDLNNIDEDFYNWHRVLKNGTLSDKISYMPCYIKWSNTLNGYNEYFLWDIFNLLWSKEYRSLNDCKKYVYTYLDLALTYNSTHTTLLLSGVYNALRTLKVQDNEIGQFLMDIINLRNNCEDANFFADRVNNYTQTRQARVICKDLQITTDEFEMMKNDRYWDENFYSQYLKGNTNAIILYLKMYNAYRTIMPCNYLIGIVRNAIKKADERKIEYKVKGNPMDIIKKIADDYARANEENTILAEVNKIFKANQTSLNLNFENKDFIVKVPTTYDELLAEGSALKNCLAHFEFNNYIKNGRRRIAFVRRKSDPDKACIACDIDVYANSIEQFLAYGNSYDVGKDGEAFKKAYQQYLSTLPIVKDTLTTHYDDDDLAERKFNEW